MSVRSVLSAILLYLVPSLAFGQLAQAQPINSLEWGYVNKKGIFVIPPQFKKCGAFSDNGFAAVSVDGKNTHAFIDTNGVVLETEVEKFKVRAHAYYGLLSFYCGRGLIKSKGRWGYLNTQGKIAIPLVYDEGSVFDDGYATVRKGSRWYIIDINGNENPLDTIPIHTATRFHDGISVIRVGEYFGYMDTSGKVILEPVYKSVGYFSEGKGWVKRQNKTVDFVNARGEWITDKKLWSARRFSEGYARVYNGRENHYIDSTGQELWLDIARFGEFRNGRAFARDVDKVGFIGKDGRWKIEPKFSEVRDFHFGMAAAQVEHFQVGYAWGFIDTTGNWVIKPSFSSIRDFMPTRP